MRYLQITPLRMRNSRSLPIVLQFYCDTFRSIQRIRGSPASCRAQIVKVKSDRSRHEALPRKLGGGPAKLQQCLRYDVSFSTVASVWASRAKSQRPSGCLR